MFSYTAEIKNAISKVRSARWYNPSSCSSPTPPETWRVVQIVLRVTMFVHFLELVHSVATAWTVGCHCVWRFLRCCVTIQGKLETALTFDKMLLYTTCKMTWLICISSLCLQEIRSVAFRTHLAFCKWCRRDTFSSAVHNFRKVPFERFPIFCTISFALIKYSSIASEN